MLTGIRVPILSKAFLLEIMYKLFYSKVSDISTRSVYLMYFDNQVNACPYPCRLRTLQENTSSGL